MNINIHELMNAISSIATGETVNSDRTYLGLIGCKGDWRQASLTYLKE